MAGFHRDRRIRCRPGGSETGRKPALTGRRQKLKVREIANQIMLTRIFLVVALLAALAVGVVNVVLVKDKINTLVTDRNTQRSDKVAAQGERDKANKNLAKAKEELDQSKQELAESKTERDKAVATAAQQVKKAEELTDKLARTTSERDDAQTKLAAYVATSYSADQVGQLGRTLKNTKEELDIAKEEQLVLQRADDPVAGPFGPIRRHQQGGYLAGGPARENSGG